MKNDNVIGVDDDIASRWGPRVVDFLQARSSTRRPRSRRRRRQLTPRSSTARGRRPSLRYARPVAVATRGCGRRLGSLAGVGAVLVATVLGLVPRAGRAAGRRRSFGELLDHLPVRVACTPALNDREAAIVWELRFPRVVLGAARRGDALGGRRLLPGRVPQPAGRPLPARRGRRRRPGATLVIVSGGTAPASSRSPPSPARSGPWPWPTPSAPRAIGSGRRPRSCWPASPSPASSPRCRPTCSSATTTTRSARSTPGSSAG